MPQNLVIASRDNRVVFVFGGDGYLRVKIDGSAFLLHRIAYLYINGLMPTNEIDHINGNKSDNRICNLRDVTTSLNQMNRRMQSNNKSGLTGVSWNHRRIKWKVTMTAESNVVFMGFFDSLLDACCRCISERNNHKFTFRHGK